jgi:hypothetical protein
VKVNCTAWKFTSSASGVVGGGSEIAAVEDHVALHLAKAACAQLVRELPHALVGEFRIAAAANHDIAVEHAIGRELARDQDVGVECERRAQEIQRRR